MIGQLGELFEIVAAIDDAGVEQSGRSARGSRCGSGGGGFGEGFCGGPLFGHAITLTGQKHGGNFLGKRQQTGRTGFGPARRRATG